MSILTGNIRYRPHLTSAPFSTPRVLLVLQVEEHHNQSTESQPGLHWRDAKVEDLPLLKEKTQ